MPCFAVFFEKRSVARVDPAKPRFYQRDDVLNRIIPTDRAHSGKNQAGKRFGSKVGPIGEEIRNSVAFQCGVQHPAVGFGLTDDDRNIPKSRSVLHEIENIQGGGFGFLVEIGTGQKANRFFSVVGRDLPLLIPQIKPPKVTLQDPKCFGAAVFLVGENPILDGRIRHGGAFDQFFDGIGYPRKLYRSTSERIGAEGDRYALGLTHDFGQDGVFGHGKTRKRIDVKMRAFKIVLRLQNFRKACQFVRSRTAETLFHFCVKGGGNGGEIQKFGTKRSLFGKLLGGVFQRLTRDPVVFQVFYGGKHIARERDVIPRAFAVLQENAGKRTQGIPHQKRPRSVIR